MPGTRSQVTSDSMTRIAAAKRRATAARKSERATKAWRATATAAAAGTIWRVTSAWIEEACGTRCVDLTHVSTGRTRTVRFPQVDSVEACRAGISD